MKKSFLLILASLFAIFALAGCADSSKDDNAAAGTVPAEYAGTYNVKFFGTQVTNAKGFSMAGQDMSSMASLFYISNDCLSAQALYPDIVNAGNNQNQCQNSINLLDGKVVISVDNGNMNITSRMQMEGTSLDMSPSDKYQYTKYYQTSSLSGKGVTGWNYDAANNAPSANSTEYPESTFTISQLDNGSIRIDMTLVGKTVNAAGMSGTVDAVNTIILEKVDDNVTELKNEIQYQFGQSNPGDTTPTGLAALAGTYNVTFFGSQVTNPKGFSMAG